MNKIIKNFKNIKYGPAPEDDSEVINWIKKFLLQIKIILMENGILLKDQKRLR